MLRPILLVSFCLAAGLPAQVIRPSRPVAPAPGDSGSATVVSGFVLDSMTNLPVVGATVVIVGTPYSTTTDPGGRFRFEVDSLPNGVYALGFIHPVLDSLGISLPTRQVSIQHGRSLFVELAVPSMATVLRAACPDSALGDGRGLAMGVVRDAATSAPIPGVRVVFMWTGINVGGSSVLKVPRAASTVTDSSGVYRLCGLPSDTRVTAQARQGTRHTGWIEVAVPANGITMRNFLVGTPRPATPATVAQRPDTGAESGNAVAAGGAGDSTRVAPTTPAAQPAAPPAPLGTAVVTGTVATESGAPIEGAQVLLLGTRLATRTDERGAFRLTGLPAGTQSIEIRQIGYSPRRYAVDLAPGRTSEVAAVLAERATVLESIEVTARAGSAIPGFDERRRRGAGYFMTEEDIEKTNPITTTDLFRMVPGLQVVWTGSDYVVQNSRSMGLGVCPVQYYIDGAPFLSIGGDIDQVVQPYDIEAIEVYKSASDTPVQFQTTGGNPCGTIVIWTKRGGKKK